MKPDGSRRFDCAVIGGGIVGLAVARELLRAARTRRRFDLRSLVVLEKEPGIAFHQSGRNSGVIHSGIYYAPGSLRARNCRRGVKLLLRFCRAHGVPFRLSGKVIVARGAAEQVRLDELERRGRANGVPGLRRLDRAGLRKIEPHAEGDAALHSPTSGVIRYREVAAALGRLIEGAGGRVETGAGARGIVRDGSRLRILTAAGEVSCRLLVNCAGLHADRVARLAGDEPGLSVVPFRGEYFRLRAAKTGLVRGLIYPVPDPRFPFLGVHLHRTMDDDVAVGPNAVLAAAREGYRFRDVNLRDLWEMVRDPGFRRFAMREWRAGAGELRRSLSKRVFVAGARRLVPDLIAADLEPGSAGVRATALLPNGRIADDFRVLRCENRIHVLSAPSPAATACLAIAEHITGLALR